MKPDLFDICILVGIILLCIGLWLISPAVSLCVMGIAAIAVGFFGAVRKGTNSGQKGGEKS